MTRMLKNKNKKGFSLVELLLVVAILAVLFAVGVPALVSLQKNLRQTELDAKAETLYIAVQNKLSKMKANGDTDILKAGSNGVTAITSTSLLSGGYSSLSYFTSKDINTTGSASNYVMSDDTADASLMSNHWVVEFDPTNYVVYGVYYSESEIDVSTAYNPNSGPYETSYREKDNRFNGTGARVGYYGGGTPGTVVTVKEIYPTLTVVNAEKLVATVECTMPDGVSEAPIFKIVIEDTAGNVSEKSYDPANISDTNCAISQNGKTYTLTLTLDSLYSDATRFVNLYGKKEAKDSTDKSKLLCGTPIKITATASCPACTTCIIKCAHSATQITNSLFADDNSIGTSNGLNAAYGTNDSNCAVIKYGRHLQNLDESSGVNYTDSNSAVISKVQYAKLGANIDFSENNTASGLKNWYETYCETNETQFFNGPLSDDITPNFKPITNSELVRFYGEAGSNCINGLRENTSSNAGLFLQLTNGQSVDNITLTGASVISAGTSGTSAGVLVGTTTGTVNISNVTMAGTSVVASGTNASAGAVAGTAAGTTSISNVIMTGTSLTGTCAGAAAGTTAGTVNISNTQVYLTEGDIGTGDNKKTNEDIWISGTASAGGLVGTVTDETLSVTITNSSASTVIGSYDKTSTTAVTKDDDGNITAIKEFTTSVAGGLIGSINGGTVSLLASYADNYLAGTTAGGLVGKGSSALTIDSCYAAGFMSFKNADDSAGITKTAQSVSNSYSIMRGLYLSSGVSLKIETASVVTDTPSYVFSMPSTEEIETLVSASGSYFAEPDNTDTSTTKPVIYHLKEDIPDEYTYPVLKSLRHYGDYGTGFTLTLKNLMSASSTDDYYWQKKDITEGFSTITDIDTDTEYTAPSTPDWKLDGWYISTGLKDKKPTDENIKVLNADGSVNTELAAGSYDGYTISTSGEKKVLTLTKDMTLYACWHQYGGIYVLTDSFVDGGEYIITNGTTGTVQSIYHSSVSSTSTSATTLSVTNTTIADGGKADRPYIEEQNFTGKTSWSQIVWKAKLSKSFYDSLQYKASESSNNDTSTDYGACFHLQNESTGYYLTYKCESTSSNYGYIGLSAALEESSGTNYSWSFEYRMWNYKGTYNAQAKTVDDAGLYQRWGPIITGWKNNQLYVNRSNPGTGTVYIYQKQEDAYTFNCNTLTYYNGNTIISTVSFSKGAALNIADYPASYTVGGKTYVCDGWSLTDGGDVAYKSSKVTGTTASFNDDTVLYAHWKEGYTVTYEINGGTNLTPADVTVKVIAGDNVTLPTAERTGYTLKGWTTTSDGSGNVYSAGAKYTVNSDTTFTAKWEPNKYNITYNMANGGTNSSSNPGTYTYGTGVGSFEAATGKTGYKFNGWFDAATGGNKIESISSTETGDKTLYAQWKPIKYTITFNANGGSGTMTSMTSLEYDKEYTLTSIGSSFTREGYKFEGWTTASDGSGTSYSDGAKVKNLTTADGASVPLYAKWKPNKYDYTVNYIDEDTNAVLDTKTGSADFNSTVTAADQVKTIDNYVKTQDGVDITISTDTSKNVISIYYSKDENGPDGTSDGIPDKNEYKLTYDSNGGTGTMTDSNLYPSGHTKTLASNTLKKEGMAFDYWSLNGTKVTQVTFANADITVQAEWKNGLYIEKTVDKTEVTVGEEVTYTIKVKNETDTAANGLQVLDVLDSRLEYVSSSGSYSYDTVAKAWTGISVPANGSVTLTLKVKTSTSITEEVTITNTATLTKTGDTSSVDIKVIPYKLTLQKGTKEGTNSNITKIWSAAIPADGISSASEVKTYTKPDIDGWTFEGWYATHTKSADGTPSGTKVLDADGKVVATSGGTGFSVSGGKLTLSDNVTLYGCWSKKGTTTTNNDYVLTSTFDAGKDYIIVSSNGAGSAYAVYQSAAGGTVSSTTVTIVEDSKHDGNPYIENTNASLVWNAEWVESETWKDGNNNSKTYSGFYRLVNKQYSGYYLYNYCEYKQVGAVNKAVTTKKDDSDSVGGCSYEFRMWRYDSANGLIPGYGHDLGVFHQVAYFNGSSLETSAEALNSGESSSTSESDRHSASIGTYTAQGYNQVYIYQKDADEEETDDIYTFDFYTVKWANYDGSLLENDENVADGETPTYDSTTPTKEADEQYTYTFKGWDKTISAATENVTYTAEYDKTKNKYTVTWKNSDGTTLETDTGVEYGTTPSYDGSTPTKSKDAQYTYTFKGWDKTISAVTGDVTYTAEYDKTVNKYTVTWKNSDGTTLETDTGVEYGTMPSYDGGTPTKSKDAQYTYTFKGWDKTISAVTGDVTYTAEYTKTKNKYTVTWKNADGTTLETDTGVEYGATPSYNGSTPAKASTAQYTYTFKGWTPTVTTVIGDVTYTAEYTETKNKYTVTWLNADGTTLETDTGVEYGTTPSYNGSTPAKSSTAQYTYTFKGWTPTVTTVTGDATYTAEYDETVRKYTVTFNMNGHGTQISSQEVEYNEYAVEPTAPSEAGHKFSGWYTDSNFTTEYNFSTPVTANIVLYARWMHAVKFHDGHSGKTVVTLYYYDGNDNWYDENATQASLPTVPTWDTYTPYCWSVNNTGAPTKITKPTELGTATDVYACWTKELYAPATSLEAGKQYLIATGSATNKFYYIKSYSLKKDGSENPVSGTTFYNSESENINCYDTPDKNYLWSSSKDGNYVNLKNNSRYLTEVSTVLQDSGELIAAKWSVTNHKLTANERSGLAGSTYTFDSTYVYVKQAVYTYGSAGATPSSVEDGTQPQSTFANLFSLDSPQSLGVKPEAEEAEPEGQAAEPEIDEPEPEGQVAEPDIDEGEPEGQATEPEGQATEPETEETEPETDEAEPETGDNVPFAGESASVPEDGSKDESDGSEESVAGETADVPKKLAEQSREDSGEPTVS